MNFDSLTRNSPFHDPELVLLGQHHIDVAFDVRVLFDEFVADALLNRGLQLLHTGDALLLVESAERNMSRKSIDQIGRFLRAEFNEYLLFEHPSELDLAINLRKYRCA